MQEQLVNVNQTTEKALLNVKEMCDYLGIGQTKARELLADLRNKFTVRIGNRLYAHKESQNDTYIAVGDLEYGCRLLRSLNCSEQQQKSLINIRFYGSMIGIFDVSFLSYSLERRHKWGNPLMVNN